MFKHSENLNEIKAHELVSYVPSTIVDNPNRMSAKDNALYSSGIVKKKKKSSNNRFTNVCICTFITLKYMC